MSGNNGDVFTRVWNNMPYKNSGYANQTSEIKSISKKSIESTEIVQKNNNIEVKQ